jgi:hypothetical protein
VDNDFDDIFEESEEEPQEQEIILIDLGDEDDRDKFMKSLSEFLDISMEAASHIAWYAKEMQELDMAMQFLQHNGFIEESGMNEYGETLYDATDKLLSGDYDHEMP